MAELDDNTLQEFKTEADELIAEAEKCLLQLDKNEDFDPNYNSIFRVFHSLKGAAGMLNLTALQEHMHKIENLFQNLKAVGKIEKNEIDFFLKSCDCAKRILSGETVPFNYDLQSKKDTPATAQTPVTANTENKKIIMVVDDEPDIVDVLCAMLNEFGFSAKGFTKPKEALAALKEISPNAILTDMTMPEMSGVALQKKIRETNTYIPIIFITGAIDKAMLIELISNGVFCVIEKPFHPITVITSVKQASERYELLKLVEGSIRMVMYQFSDLDEHLKTKGLDEHRKLLRQEIESLQKRFQQLKNPAKSHNT